MKKSYVLTIDTDIVKDEKKWLLENGLNILEKLASKVAAQGKHPMQALLELIEEDEISGDALIIYTHYALDLIVTKFNSMVESEMFKDGSHE